VSDSCSANRISGSSSITRIRAMVRYSGRATLRFDFINSSRHVLILNTAPILSSFKTRTTYSLHHPQTFTNCFDFALPIQFTINPAGNGVPALPFNNPAGNGVPALPCGYARRARA
jgi:hypothetical protein